MMFEYCDAIHVWTAQVEIRMQGFAVNRSTTGLIVVLCIAVPATAQAYIGPGAGIGAIGTVLAVIGAVLMMIVGFLWYPIKRLINRNKRAEEEVDAEVTAETATAADEPPDSS